ncbi:MAG: hypothetical protein A2X54_08955 [Nitrospirae bacterium GWF2_44_13]|nr:MAG: hypothetical protein A2X54_08955 [Nitrospirae bacterium GWF2_44_13]OGW65780.1 MAG: hypothetical protein A2222_05555 [Nitrospirae bacterium RIFOXYA2_FULL_44_9]
MRHIFAIMITALILFYPSHGFTTIKEIVSEGAYNMGDGETPTVAESRALLNAKRIALEQAGTYVESYTKVENIQVTKDEIQVLTSGIMEVEILDKKRTVVGDGFRFWVKIKTRVNSDNIKEMARKVKDKSVVDDYKKIQEAYDKSQREIKELKKQLAQTKDKKEKKQVEAKISDDERMFQANEWFEKGNKYLLSKEYDKAREAFTVAIAFNPNFADAYNQRAASYINLDAEIFLAMAIEDYSKAIAIDPNDGASYFNRGNRYDAKGQTYSKKGAFYEATKQFDRAIEDYNKAIGLKWNFSTDYDYSLKFTKNLLAIAYVNRGSAYGEKGHYDRAIEDFNKAISINPNYAGAYNNRGNAYYKKGQYDRAIEDYNKAIALDPNDALAYTNRGAAYALKGVMGRAISDFQKGCDMGYELGCENLQKALQSR